MISRTEPYADALKVPHCEDCHHLSAAMSNGMHYCKAPMAEAHLRAIGRANGAKTPAWHDVSWVPNNQLGMAVVCPLFERETEWQRASNPSRDLLGTDRRTTA